MPDRLANPALVDEPVTVILDRVDVTQLLMGYSVSLPKFGIVLTPSVEIQRIAFRCKTRFAGTKTSTTETEK